MKPDLIVEVKNGAVVGIFSDLPVSMVLVDWDHAVEPDGVTSFMLEDGSGVPQIAAAEPVRPEPLEQMSAETKRVVGLLTGVGNRSHAG